MKTLKNGCLILNLPKRMKLLKLTILLFSLAMILTVVKGIKTNIEAVQSLERWMK